MSDTERLIEEAGRVVAQAEKQSALDAKYPPCTCSAPPRGHTMRQHDYRRLRVDELRAVLSACGNLVTALRAERERADKATLEALELKQRGRSLELVSADAIRERDELAAGLRSANALYETCKIDRDEYFAANLAANKRIVALEHERDAARAEAERDAALKQSAEWEIQAQDVRDRLIKAEAERDAQHDLVLRLTAERDEASIVHACPPKGSGVMPCCWATPFEKQGERLTADPALVTSAERHYLLYLRVNAPRLAPSVRNQPPRHTDEKPHHPPQKQREPVRSSL